MRIIEMTATFGCLNKATLRPGADFTLVTADNESGKSTWAAFLRAMLYGFPARDRNKEGYLAEKNRYQPWSGAPMEGSLTLEWQGRSLTLRRGPRGTTPWGSFSAVWTASAQPVEGLTAENCGETLLGVSREVFERTAFVGQGEISLSPSADLEKRVAALATSGEEDVSFSQVERRLKDWLNRRRANARFGLIPELEADLAQVEDCIARQGTLLRRSQEARQEKEALEQKRVQLEAQLRELADRGQAQQAQNHRQAQVEYDQAQAELESAQRTAQALPPAEELRRAQGDLSYLNTLAANFKQAERSLPQARERAEQARQAAQADPFFGSWEMAQAAAKAQADHDQALRLKQRPSPPLFLLLGALLGALPGVILAFAAPEPLVQLGFSLGLMEGCVVSFATMLWVLLPCLLLGGAAGLLAALLRGRSRDRAFAAILAQYGAQTPQDILIRAGEYGQKVNTAQEAERDLQSLEAERDKLLAQKEELTAQLLDLVHPFAPEVTDLFGISAALSRALQQGENYNLAKLKAEQTQKRLTALPSPEAAGAPILAATGEAAAISAQLGAVNGELARVSDDHAQLRGQLGSLGDPADLEARRDSLREQLSLRRGEFEAISTALEALKAADSLLRERFSPAVNQRAGAYLSALTGGRYDTAALTRQFQALAQEAGGTSPRQDLALSGGAAQQLYLAARLAMCDLALPQADPCPILLDDALDAFDDQRAKRALECLLEVARRRQVLLFTCHGREKEMLAGKDITFLEV